MEIKTTEEIENQWDLQTGNPPYPLEGKEWVALEEINKCLDDWHERIKTRTDNVDYSQNDMVLEAEYFLLQLQHEIRKILINFENAEKVRKTKEE